jgi:hypothetical protein
MFRDYRTEAQIQQIGEMATVSMHLKAAIHFCG